MNSKDLLGIVHARSKKLEHAFAFKGHRLLAQSPTTARANQTLLEKSRFLAYPLGAVQLAYDDMDSHVTETNDAEASATFMISNPRRDRHGDIVLPEGCLDTITDYQLNPRNFFSHKSSEMPIGSCRSPKGEFKLWIEDDKIFSTIYFHQLTQESRDVCELVLAKELQAASIGFLPIFGEFLPDPEQPESKDEINFDFGGIVFSKWSMLEWSVVAVPANPDAVRSRLSSPKANKMSMLVRKSLEEAVGPIKRRPVMFWNQESGLKVAAETLAKEASLPDTSATDPITEEDEHSVQALLFWPDKYPNEAAVLAWLDEKQLTTENVFPGEKEGDPWVALQFPANECLADSDSKEELEPSVVAVYCKRIEAKPENETPVSEQTLPTQERGMKNKPKKKAEVPNHEEPEVVKPSDKPEEDNTPYGCSFLKSVSCKMKEVGEHLEKGSAKLDHEGVKKFASSLKAKNEEAIGKLQEFGKSTYPDHFKDEGDDTDDEDKDPEDDKDPEEEDDEEDLDVEPPMAEGEEEDEEDLDEEDSELEDPEDDEDPLKKPKAPKKKPVVKPEVAGRSSSKLGRSKMARKDLGLVKEACEFLKELSQEENLKRSQKTASAHHSQCMESLIQKYSKADPTEEPVEGKQVAEEATPELQAKIKKFNDLFYSLTGTDLDA